MSRTSLIPASTLIPALVVLLAANIAPAQQGPDTVAGFVVGSPGQKSLALALPNHAEASGGTPRRYPLHGPGNSAPPPLVSLRARAPSCGPHPCTRAN